MKEIFEGRVKRIVCGTRISYTVGYSTGLDRVTEIHIYRERNGLIVAEVVLDNGETVWVNDVSEFRVKRKKQIDTETKA